MPLQRRGYTSPSDHSHVIERTPKKTKTGLRSDCATSLSETATTLMRIGYSQSETAVPVNVLFSVSPDRLPQNFKKTQNMGLC